jgi:hypothetical protein
MTVERLQRLPWSTRLAIRLVCLLVRCRSPKIAAAQFSQTAVLQLCVPFATSCRGFRSVHMTSSSRWRP